VDHRLYSIKDRTAEQFGPVFQAVNDGVATRSFVQLLSKVVPWDRDAFKLFFVGVFSDRDGHVEALDSPEEIDVNMPKLPDVGDDDE